MRFPCVRISCKAQPRAGRLLLASGVFCAWLTVGAHATTPDPSAESAASEPDAVSSASASASPPAEETRQVLTASDTAGITAAMGKEVVLEGTVSRIGESKTRQILFINFDEVDRGGVSVIIKQGTLAGDFVLFEPGFADRLIGKRVRFTGEISEFRNAPQLQVFAPSQIEIVEPTPAVSAE